MNARFEDGLPELLVGAVCLCAFGALWWLWPVRQNTGAQSRASSRGQGRAAVGHRRAATRHQIALVVLGRPMAERWRREAVRVSREVFRLTPLWLPRRELPSSAWHRGYRRYRAERLCRSLAAIKPRGASRIVGLVSVDISTRQPGFRDHAVFGLADVGGPAAVLSNHKLKHAQGPKPMTPLQQRKLWRGLLLHEIGHLFRLPHCPTQSCPMFNADASIPALLRMTPTFCPRCLAAVRD